MPRRTPVVPPIDLPPSHAELASAGGRDITAAAEFLGCGRDKVKELIARGELPSYADGGKTMVPLRALQLRIEAALARARAGHRCGWKEKKS